jgi:transcriptional regulator with XRE-family HTH domain
MSNIGTKIKSIRVINGFFSTQVASVINLSDSAYGKIERGESGIDVDKLKLLANFFKIPLHVLTDETPFYNLTNGNNSPVALHHSQVETTNEKLIDAQLKISEQITILIEKINIPK